MPDKTPNKPKISLLIPNLAGGGAERVMVILANEFCKRAYPVDLVIVNSDDMHYASELSDKVNLVNLKKRRAMSAIFSIRRYLRSEKPSVLVTTLGHVTAAAAIALWLSGKIPTAFYPREDRAPQRYSLRTAYLFFLSLIIKWAYQRADGIISLSDDMAQQLKQHYKISTRVHTIYNPIYFDSILPKAQQAMHPSPPWGQDSKFILGVGRLTSQKDFATLIRSAAEANQRNETKLVILGDGPERKALLSLAKELDYQDSLYMPGFVENPFAFMNAADIFVLSSVLEGLPNALIQALACGTTCISTNCPTGPREVLQGGKYGSLVEIGDSSAIAQLINQYQDGKTRLTPPTSVLQKKYDASSIAESYLKALIPHRYYRTTEAIESVQS